VLGGRAEEGGEVGERKVTFKGEESSRFGNQQPAAAPGNSSSDFYQSMERRYYGVGAE
jgi:hypothetical protein